MNAFRKIIMGGAALTLAASSAFGAGTDWPHTGHDAGGQRFSPLTQVNKSNVNKLQPAWTYHLTPANYQGRPRLVEATPLVIGNTMVITSTYGQIIALDATTGAEKWKYDLPDNDIPSAHGSAYSPYAKAVIFGSRMGRLYSLDLATGKLNAGFGTGGIVNMKTPEVMQTGMQPVYDLPSPGVIYKNLIITGAARPMAARVLAPPATPAPGMRKPASWSGPSTPCRVPANPITTPGRRKVRRTARA